MKNARAPLEQSMNVAAMPAGAAKAIVMAVTPKARGTAAGGTARAAVVRRIITSVSVPRPPFVSAC
jgi:hypothetical protein